MDKRIRTVTGTMFLAVLASGCGVVTGGTPRSTATTTAPLSTQAEMVASTTTTMPVVDSRLVLDCVDYVQFGAFTGNQLLLAMWNEAGQDVSALRAACEQIGRTNTMVLAGMSEQWRNIETWIAATQSSPVTEPPPPPSTEPAPPPETLPPPPETQPEPPPETLPLPPPPTVAEPTSGCDPNDTGACAPIASNADSL